jgi:hypothetical protein
VTLSGFAAAWTSRGAEALTCLAPCMQRLAHRLHELSAVREGQHHLLLFTALPPWCARRCTLFCCWPSIGPRSIWLTHPGFFAHPHPMQTLLHALLVPPASLPALQRRS